jgi:protein-S-isoprenylcysteine O-methyltransferase Ste14
MTSKSIEWAKKEHSPQKRLLLILFLTIPFVALPTLLLSRLAPAVDKRLRLPSWRGGRLALFVGALLAISGWLLAVWTIVTQFTRAQGTPSPTMATQKLLADGPFSLCRNPMALGTILAYLGTGVMVGSPFAVGVVALFAAVLSLYIKTVEEKELLVRFGDEYAAYKQNTPFLIPFWGKRTHLRSIGLELSANEGEEIA